MSFIQGDWNHCQQKRLSDVNISWNEMFGNFYYAYKFLLERSQGIICFTFQPVKLVSVFQKSAIRIKLFLFSLENLSSSFTFSAYDDINQKDYETGSNLDLDLQPLWDLFFSPRHEWNHFFILFLYNLLFSLAFFIWSSKNNFIHFETWNVTLILIKYFYQFISDHDQC